MARGTGNAYMRTNNPAFNLSPDTINDLLQYIIGAVADKSFPWDSATHTYTNINGSWTLVGSVYFTGRYASFIATSFRREAIMIVESNGTWTVDALMTSWRLVGTMTGGNNVTLTNLPVTVHEYLINWRMNSGFAYKTIVFPVDTYFVNDSFYFSSEYYEVATFLIQDGILSVVPAWATGNYGGTTLSKSDVTAYIYAR
jgi:hypothetical protein